MPVTRGPASLGRDAGQGCAGVSARGDRDFAAVAGRAESVEGAEGGYLPAVGDGGMNGTTVRAVEAAAFDA
jgi:hypothetical protein